VQLVGLAFQLQQNLSIAGHNDVASLGGDYPPPHARRAGQHFAFANLVTGFAFQVFVSTFDRNPQAARHIEQQVLGSQIRLGDHV
jgi:hypothetical protein